MISKLKLIAFSFFIIITTGCSVEYAPTPVVDDKIPEFLFNDASIVRYKDGSLVVEVEAGNIERYKDSDESFGKNVKFTSYDDNKADTVGSCDYIFTNSDSEIYELYDNIQIESFSEDMKVMSDALKWNGKTEQLTSSRGDVVKIEKENTTLEGTGFSASGVSKTFSFSGNVVGRIETE